MVESQTNPNFFDYHYNFLALFPTDAPLDKLSKGDLNRFNSLLGRIHALEFDESNSKVREGVVSFSKVPNSRDVLNVILENLTRLSPEKLKKLGIGIKEMIFLIKLISFLDKIEFQGILEVLIDLLAKTYCETETYKNMVKKAIEITNDTSPIFQKNTFVTNFLLKLGYISQSGDAWFILPGYEERILELINDTTFVKLVDLFVLSDTSLANRIVGQEEANKEMQAQLMQRLKTKVIENKDNIPEIARLLGITFNNLTQEGKVRDFLKSITEISSKIEEIITEWKNPNKPAQDEEPHQMKTA